jgi:hypothetical protein
LHNIFLFIIVPIISNYDSVNLQNISVTLTFEEGTWFLDTTECCHETDICAKLFQNPSMLDKVTYWTWLLCKWDTRTDSRTWTLAAMHRPDMVDIKNVPSNYKIFPCMTKLQCGHECVSLNSSRENEYLQTISMTLTLKVGTWVLVATCRLDVEDIYA